MILKRLPPTQFKRQSSSKFLRGRVLSSADSNSRRTAPSQAGDLSLFRAIPTNFEFVAPVFLSVEQNKVLGLIKEGENVFYTGSAGE